jgi:hypothetical protein
MSPTRPTNQTQPPQPTRPTNHKPETNPASNVYINTLSCAANILQLKLSNPKLEIKPPTPKRKRGNEQPKPKIGPKSGPENSQLFPSKKNPHPQNKHKIFMNVEGKIQLLTHQGLATSSRNKFKRKNPQENSPAPSTPPNSPHNKNRRKSDDFKAKLKLFQQEKTAKISKSLTVPHGENEFTSSTANIVTTIHHPNPIKKTHPESTTLKAMNWPSSLQSKETSKIYKEDPPLTTPFSENSKESQNLQNPSKSSCTTPAPKLTSDVSKSRTASSKNSKIFEFWRGKSPPIRDQIGKKPGPKRI